MGVMTQSANQLVPTTTLASVERASTATVVSQSGARWTVGESEVEERLNTYLVNHNEYAGASDVFSYARVVSYDAWAIRNDKLVSFYLELLSVRIKHGGLCR